MNIYKDPPTFRPMHIELVDQDDYDKLENIVFAVANNKINHSPQLIEAAKAILSKLHRVEDAP